ncbi:isoaspartyl peptidase/L-asparaginase family protein [Granulicoccus sp. GXG6511]|uniref:isoaspartyl peptidase/L-asparaginase family protein n=1 Tax=Granulicoccus sp. GXG6511 TaxID=3381351 RepID=UPI003D7D910E
MTVRVMVAAPARPWSLVIHGGAGGPKTDGAADELSAYHVGLRAAYEAGEAVLAEGGAALDAVCAAVRTLEDDPIFNAGRGAVLAADGTAEHDASVMTGDGRAGAVTVSRRARNPVELARVVRDRSPHVLLADPPREVLDQWSIEEVDPAWFVTEFRIEQLRTLQAAATTGPRHGTVGAVALDLGGALAAATSTGGMSNKANGRVGDSPVIGAGTYARDGVVAVSTTGEGEAFLEGVVAHDVYARMAYGGVPLPAAVEATLATELGSRDAMGALIAVGADGRLAVGTRSDTMLAAWRDGDEIVTRT